MMGANMHKQGQRHSLPCILTLATAAVLCGMEGYKAISSWADDLGHLQFKF